MTTAKKPASKKASPKKTAKKPFDWDAWEARQAALEKEVHEMLEVLRGRVENLEDVYDRANKVVKVQATTIVPEHVAEQVVRRLIEPQCFRTTKVRA